MADQSYRLGPALAADSYLSIGAILEAAQKSRSTLIHPGYGFLAERAHFATAVEEAGFTFVGPPPAAIERMGDKAAAQTDRRRGRASRSCPARGNRSTSPWRRRRRLASGIPCSSRRRSGRRQGHARRPRRGPARGIAQPRGPRGAVVLRAFRGLPRALRRSGATTSRRRSWPTRSGNVVFLGERDCSVQRRHQKLIEETPSPLFDAGIRERFADAATSLAREAGYVNAGTVECILDEDGSFYFLEMNTRMQVEHPVTEMVTGLDLVALQIQVALGGSLAGLEVAPNGHAIECRINAEDPGRNFLPGPGRITRYEEPSGPFVRVDSGVGAGREIPGDYDSLFAKLIVSGTDRDQARRRMLRALDEFVVEGVPTTIPVHRWILGVEGVQDLHAHDDVARARARRRAPAGPGRSGARRPGSRARPARATSSSRSTGDGCRSASSTNAASRRPRLPSSHAAHHREHVHGEIRAPMQGTIVKVLVEKGQSIQAGDVVCILEAMKMENHIASTREGEITELPIRAGQVVELGALLAGDRLTGRAGRRYAGPDGSGIGTTVQPSPSHPSENALLGGRSSLIRADRVARLRIGTRDGRERGWTSNRPAPASRSIVHRLPSHDSTRLWT